MRRDIRHSFREFILIYGLLAPFLFALILRALMPAVGDTSINLVVTPELGEEMTERLRQYAKVEVVETRRQLESRVLALDDAAGIVIGEGGAYEVILEGNEAHDTAVLPGIILADILSPSALEVSEVDLGRVGSPLRPMLSALLAMMAMLMGGMIIGFNIIDDKENATLPALAVSPLSRGEYIAGRSALGLLLATVLAMGSLFLMGMGPVNVGQVLVVVVAGSSLAVIYGLYTGSIADSQISGIATVKVGSLAFLIAPLLTALIPEKFHLGLYWVPTYWTYLAFNEVFVEAGPWSEVLRLAGINVLVSLIFLAGSWRLLSRKLALRG
jgi:ABC-2 type transport system permease protein